MTTGETWLTALSMIGEWGIVFVIYWELESNRLDRFLETAFSSEHSQARLDIYSAYCGLSPSVETSRNVAFRDLLGEKKDLRKQCDRELALLERIGNGLPCLPPFRRRALGWFPHSVIFLWEILSPYVQQRREASIPDWAGHFVHLASASLGEVQRQGKTELILRDPDRGRSRDIVLTSHRLLEIGAELKRAAKTT
jgi:hypothetical protein